MECSSYRATQLMEHAMKIIQCTFEARIREKVVVDNMHFGFRPENLNYRCNLCSEADAGETGQNCTILL